MVCTCSLALPWALSCRTLRYVSRFCFGRSLMGKPRPYLVSFGDKLGHRGVCEGVGSLWYLTYEQYKACCILYWISLKESAYKITVTHVFSRMKWSHYHRNSHNIIIRTCSMLLPTYSNTSRNSQCHQQGQYDTDSDDCRVIRHGRHLRRGIVYPAHIWRVDQRASRTTIRNVVYDSRRRGGRDRDAGHGYYTAYSFLILDRSGSVFFSLYYILRSAQEGIGMGPNLHPYIPKNCCNVSYLYFDGLG